MQASFEYDGGMVNVGPPATWTNTTESSKWVTLQEGLRQFVSAGETVDLSEEMLKEIALQTGNLPDRTVGEDGTAEINVAVQDSKVTIWWAVKFGSRSVVEGILEDPEEDKAIVTQRDESGHTLTHWAAKRGDQEIVEFICQNGAPIFDASEDDVGMLPIHWACTEGRLDVVRYFIDKGVNINCVDKQGCTPLLIAAQYGQADVAAYLIKKRADTTILDKHNDSAMNWAAYKGQLEIVALLHYLGLAVDNSDAFGQTPLHLAALRGNYPAVEYLVMDCDAPIDGRDNKDKTPLDLAKARGHGQVVKFLSMQQDQNAGLFSEGFFRALQKKCSIAAVVQMMQGDGRTAEGARYPIMMVFTFTAVEHLFYPYYFLDDGVMADYNSLHALSLAAHLWMWVCFLKAWLGDPGWLGYQGSHKKNGPLGQAYEAYFDNLVNPKARSDGEKNGALRPNLCHTCRIQRPLRLKHCRTCRTCVALFDHHCPFVGNCVGRGNYRWFFGYAFMFFVCSSLWEITAILYLRTVEFSWPVLLVAMFFFPFWCMSVTLTSYHIQLTVTNMTTNEQMNFGRYEYMENGRNRFDKGIINNCLLRFFPAEKDQHIEDVSVSLLGPNRV